MPTPSPNRAPAEQPRSQETSANKLANLKQQVEVEFKGAAPSKEQIAEAENKLTELENDTRLTPEQRRQVEPLKKKLVEYVGKLAAPPKEGGAQKLATEWSEKLRSLRDTIANFGAAFLKMIAQLLFGSDRNGAFYKLLMGLSRSERAQMAYLKKLKNLKCTDEELKKLRKNLNDKARDIRKEKTDRNTEDAPEYDFVSLVDEISEEIGEREATKEEWETKANVIFGNAQKVPKLAVAQPTPAPAATQAGPQVANAAPAATPAQAAPQPGAAPAATPPRQG